MKAIKLIKLVLLLPVAMYITKNNTSNLNSA